MGGRAFADKYSTPRLSPASYQALCAHAAAVLAPFFEEIVTPPHDPAKTSHGDVDCIVHSPTPEATPEAVGEALNAIEVIVGKPTSNYLIPWTDEFAQVDVHRCAKEWHATQVFLHSYGRLGHILSKMILRFGLYLDFRGLYTNKPTHATPAFLISDSLSTILFILHLSPSRFAEGFATREELWTWLEEGRIAGNPLTHGWRTSQPAPPIELDDIYSEWMRRREGQPRHELDREAILTTVLQSQNKEEEYDNWKLRLEREERARVAEQKRQEMIKLEVKKRLEQSSARGKEIKEAAKRIRAEVEVELAMEVQV